MTSNLPKRYIAIPLVVLAAYLSPYLILGQDHYVRIHDYLDSVLVFYKILAQSGLIFAPNQAIVPNLMGGLERAWWPSEVNVFLWFNVWFGPFGATAANEVISRLVAFFGMFLFVRRFILSDERPPLVAVLAGLCFALVPHFPGSRLSIVAQPLVLYVFLTIRARQDKWRHWLVLIFVPFYSSFVVYYFFFLASMGTLWLIDTLRKRRPDWRFVASIALMTAVFLGLEFRLVQTMLLDAQVVSHRAEFTYYQDRNLVDAASRFVDNLKNAHHHGYSFHWPVVVFTVLLAGIWGGIQRRRLRIYMLLVAGIVFCSLANGLYYSPVVEALYRVAPITRHFNISRFNLLHPLLWYLLFAVSLAMIEKLSKNGRILVLLLAGLQVAYLFYNSDFSREYREHGISYRQFYAEELFDEVEAAIGEPKESYRVAVIGMHPAIPLYNGFHTVGGYFYNYPLAYKHAFYRIIRHELAKSPHWKGLFVNWGSMAYVYSAELSEADYLIPRLHRNINHLELDPKALWNLGGRYVISALPIANPADNRLTPLRAFTHPDSAWNVFLYRLEKPATKEEEQSPATNSIEPDRLPPSE